VAFFDYLPRGAVNVLERRLAETLRGAAFPAAQVLAAFRSERYRSDRFAHAPAGDHALRHARDLLQVVFRACRAVAIHEFLRGPAAESSDDAAPQVRLRVVVAVLRGPLVGDTKRLAARRDRHAGNRI